MNSKKIYYGKETEKAVRNFRFNGRFISLHLIKALALVKQACADANYHLGCLTKQKHDAIVQACQEIVKGGLDNQFVTEVVQGGAGTSINMNINEVLSTRASEIAKVKIHYLDDVNMSQSTNDVVPTALRLVCLRLLDDYLGEQSILKESFARKANEFKDVIKVGRTHLQDAVPITLGQEFGAYLAFVDRDMHRLVDFKKTLLETNLGGTAIGTGINSSVSFIRFANQKLAELSGYSFKPAADLIDVTQNLDSLLVLIYLLEVSALGLSKIASDLRLMSSGPRAGFGEIRLPEYQKGSSIMPGKNNPVTLESVSQVAYEVSGNAQKMSHAYLGGQLELNVMFPVFITSLIDSFDLLTKSAALFSETVLKVTVDVKQCRELLEKSLSSSAALISHIGYDKTAEMVKKAIVTNVSLETILLDSKLLTGKKLREILSNGSLTKPGKV